jgi:hypothetical protein
MLPRREADSLSCNPTFGDRGRGTRGSRRVGSWKAYLSKEGKKELDQLLLMRRLWFLFNTLRTRRQCVTGKVRRMGSWRRRKLESRMVPQGFVTEQEVAEGGLKGRHRKHQKEEVTCRNKRLKESTLANFLS